ncbi:integrase, catalytic region, zinc finger, CCHC-type containing protein [Tanacetum coccineum]
MMSTKSEVHTADQLPLPRYGLDAPPARAGLSDGYDRTIELVLIVLCEIGNDVYAASLAMDSFVMELLFAYLQASSTKSWLWHRRLNHLNFGTLNELARNNLVRGLPMLKYDKDHLCPSCQLGDFQCTVRFVRTDNGTEFVNKTLDGWFESVGISHETAFLGSQHRRIVERRNRTLMEAARTMLIFAKAPLFLWAEAVATACYTLNRSLVHTLHGKTYYELLKGKKPNLQYFRVFGSLCYPTNDYDDVGKLKAIADIDPEPPSVPPTKKQVDDLFQWFDDDEVVTIPPVVPISRFLFSAAPAPENANGSPSTTVISEGAPAVTESLLPHQIPLPDTSDSDVETLFDHVDSHVFDTHHAPETDSEDLSPTLSNIRCYSPTTITHVQKWTQAHRLKTLLGIRRPVLPGNSSKRAMWVSSRKFLTHVEPKTYKQALEHSCWIEAMQEEFMSLNV